MLILGALTTDEERKIEKIHNLYYKNMYLLSYKVLKDHYLAEDSVQISLVKVLNNLEEIQIVESNQTKSYLYIITKNTALDLYNQRKKIKQVTNSLEERSYIVDGFFVDEYFANIETDMDMQYYIKKLNYDDQLILYLKYHKDYSNDMIAGVLKTTNEVVRKRLSRTRKKLKQIMGREEKGEKANG
jgi:RNA polymerase sigma-70 factor (ECF subfamily)